MANRPVRLIEPMLFNEILVDPLTFLRSETRYWKTKALLSQLVPFQAPFTGTVSAPTDRKQQEVAEQSRDRADIPALERLTAGVGEKPARRPDTAAATYGSTRFTMPRSHANPRQ